MVGASLSAQPLLYYFLNRLSPGPLNFLFSPELREAREPWREISQEPSVRGAATPGATHTTGAGAAEDPPGSTHVRATAHQL